MGRPAIKITEGPETARGRPTLAPGSAPAQQTKQLRTTLRKRIKYKRKAKRAAGIEGQVATMLESHTRQMDTIDKTTMKRARKNGNRTTKSDKTEVPPWDGQQ